MPIGLGAALAGPDGANVAAGSASVATQGSTTTITQTTDKTVINWRSFDIGAGETVRFVQPGSSSIAFNRVFDSKPTSIYGTLTANGQVWVSNAYGVLIGGGAVINTAGFLATTHDIKNEDFMAGRYNFTVAGRPDASVVNAGTITALNGGFAALVAPGVRNSGTITANFGKVALASGNGFSLDFYGDKLITLGVSDQIASSVKDVATGQTLDALVKNEGLLKANGGRVQLTAVSARQVVDSVINNKGVIEARSIGRREGKIVLAAATSKSKVVDATQNVKVSGKLDVSGKRKKGGTIQVTGEDIEVTGAILNASGATGGGTVMIGGDTGGGHVSSLVASLPQAQLSSEFVPTATNVRIDRTTVIDASAKANGDGGKVVVWSDNKTAFSGSIFARGGALGGNGGFVEVSGKRGLEFDGRVSTRATLGKNGTLLLDPDDYYVNESAAIAIQAALDDGDVIIQTTVDGTDGHGDIFINHSLSWSANTLTFSAYRNIEVASQGHENTATLNLHGTGSLVLRADNTGTGTGNVILANEPMYNRRIDATTSTGTIKIYYNPDSGYDSPTDFTIGNGRIYTNLSVPDQVTAYMLVNSPGQLQDIGSYLTSNFALGKKLDMSDEGTFSPIGGLSSFNGRFDGLGNAISNLTFSSANSSVGLFGSIGSAGVVSNLNLSKFDVTASSTSAPHAGILAGDNAGIISNVHAVGPDNAIASTGLASGRVGGLVGSNNNQISNSSAEAAVLVANNAQAGGLVGYNSGTVADSSAAGSVTGGAANLGGLVGTNANVISNSYATGSVSVSNATVGATAGGLVGYNDTSKLITGSYATGNVTVGLSTGTIEAGGLVGVNDGSLSKVYALGGISGAGISAAGGLVGRNAAAGTINLAWSSGAVGAATSVGGLVGTNGNSPGAITNAYWDKDTSGRNTSAGGTGLDTSAARTQSSYSGFDFANHWYMIDGQTRPFLRSEYSTTITNFHQLQLMAMNLGASYTIGRDFNAGSSFAAVSSLYPGMWSAAGFVPVGNQSNPFTGKLDGTGKTIDGLKIAPTATANANLIGLFGYIGQSGRVENVDLTGVHITANPNLGSTPQYVGALAGVNTGTISNVSASGAIDGLTVIGLTAGGLVGKNGDNSTGTNWVPGSIASSSADVEITAGSGFYCNTNNCGFGFNVIGGLVGHNPGRISDSSASGAIFVVGNTVAGGLVGSNDGFSGGTGPQPLIENSFATGDVTATGVNVEIGGLVGYNWGRLGNDTGSAKILDSYAIGNVTATANVTNSNCNNNGPCEFVNAGGLVGFNQGHIVSSLTPDQQNFGLTFATGDVTVGANGVAGGLVGQNDGIINSGFATGMVTGAAGSGVLPGGDERSTVLGGLVGTNQGRIENSIAMGDVGTAGRAYLLAGGLVGDNGGRIENSFAFGAVVAGNNSQAGGLAGASGSFDFINGSGVAGVGHNNDGEIDSSIAAGDVTVGSASLAGGLAGSAGKVTDSSAIGNVQGGDNSVLGGLVGVVETNVLIRDSHAFGNVRSTGANSWIGGFAGINAGLISFGSSASGNVEGTSDSVVGGLVGLNVGNITNAFTAGINESGLQSITVTGSNNLVGGLVGANFGMIADSISAVAITGGANNTMGTLVGANGNIANVEPNQILGSNFPLGTIFTSTGTGTINGVAGPEIGTSDLKTMPAAPSILSRCDDPLCKALVNPKLIPAQPVSAADLPDDVFAVTLILSLLSSDNKTDQAAGAAVLVALTAPPGGGPIGGAGGAINTGSVGGSTGKPVTNATPGVPVALPPLPLRPVAGADGERFSSIPPINETRFISNEVVLQMGNNVPVADVERIAREMGLSIISSQNLNSLGRNAFRFRIGGGQSVRNVIRTLEANSIVAVAQPNYQYKLSQNASKPDEQRGDPAQYMMSKLRLQEAHRVALGRDVTVAVIDSEVDKQHSELNGKISDQFNAVGQNEKAHSHGTAMVGAIASHDRLLGVAPGARILAVRAFSDTTQSAEGTTFDIIKSIDWAVSQGARVINMSFAGPRDPSLEKALKNAYDKGVVLVAAAGNAGPKSPPLFPGADPHVIAVTATDFADKGFKMANQGAHMSVAAPGVDILAPAPEAAYQMSTGTSIATAHVTGVVALMMERDPTLTPADVRRILEASATDLGPKGKDTQFGWGLVNPQKALQMVDARKKSAAASPESTAR